MATATVPVDERNPLTEGLERLPIRPTTLTIFGATGDLSRRKLLPALYNLAHEGALPERFNLIGAARRDQTDDEFREVMKESIEANSRREQTDGEFREVMKESIAANSRREPDPQVLDGLLERMRYVSVPFDDSEAYNTLGKLIEELDGEAGQPLARMYYLSTAPEFFAVIAEELKEAGLHRHEQADVRVVIEKPFGTDLASARKLQKVVSSVCLLYTSPSPRD